MQRFDLHVIYIISKTSSFSESGDTERLTIMATDQRRGDDDSSTHYIRKQ